MYLYKDEAFPGNSYFWYTFALRSAMFTMLQWVDWLCNALDDRPIHLLRNDCRPKPKVCHVHQFAFSEY